MTDSTTEADGSLLDRSLLTELDRIIVASRDRQLVAEMLCKVLGAEVVSQDRVPFWCAARTTLRAGISEIEILEPSGVGVLADFMGRRGPGLFAVGLASADPERFRAHLQAQGVSFDRQHPQLFLTADKGVDLPNLNLVVTPAQAREPAGLLERLWSATLLHRSVEPEQTLGRILGGRVSEVSDVRAPWSRLGATLIRLGPSGSSHLSILYPRGRETPIERFFVRYGGGIYMASAISSQLPAIEERLRHEHIPTPERSAAAPLLLPSRLLGGARLAILAEAIEPTCGNIAAPIFEAESFEAESVHEKGEARGWPS